MKIMKIMNRREFIKKMTTVVPVAIAGMTVLKLVPATKETTVLLEPADQPLWQYHFDTDSFVANNIYGQPPLKITMEEIQKAQEKLDAIPMRYTEHGKAKITYIDYDAIDDAIKHNWGR